MASDVKTKQNQRELTVDILRGITVLLMILAHTIGFIHNGANPILIFLNRFGDTICFTAFLFLSGISVYLGFLSKKNEPDLKIKVFRKTFSLLIGYYLISFITFYKDFIPLTLSVPTHVYKIIFFINVPSYAEFLITFAFFGIAVNIFPKIFLKLSRSLKLVLITGTVLYIIGSLLYYIQVPSLLISTKALLSGSSGLFRFPILQYSIVYFLGLKWGAFLKNETDQRAREKLTLYVSLLLVSLIIILQSLKLTLNLKILDPGLRWPPTVTFITIGLCFVFICFSLLFLIQRKNLHNIILRITNIFGHYALDFFIFHTIVLKLYDILFHQKFSFVPIIVFAFFVVLLLSFLLLKLDKNIYSSLKRLLKFDPDELIVEKLHKILFRRKDDKRLLKKRQFLLAFILLLTTVGSVGLIEETALEPELPPNWWDLSFAYYQRLSVKNDSFINTIYKDTTISTNFDHKFLVDTKKSQESGNDLRIVYLKDGVYKNTQFSIINPNTKETEIRINLKDDILPRQINYSYFLYYGNNFIEGTTSQLDSAINTFVTFGSEVKSELLLTVDRKWNLILDDPSNEIVITTELTKGFLPNEYTINYQLLNSELTGSLDQLEFNKWGGSLPLSDLSPGKYDIQSTIETENYHIKSNVVSFMISHPLYVEWTMDWEGYDVSNEYLNSIDQLSKRHYNLPITHFFNPRIYISPELGSSRREFLTSWVKDRRDNFGDEIGMHMHMHFDLLKAMGFEHPLGEIINPPNEENPSESTTTTTIPEKVVLKWGNYNNGYDIPTTEYSYEDFTVMLNWTKQKFIENGLNTPISYRSGGWFMNTEILRALQDSGFKLDSSGRNSYYLGNLPGPWNLTSTTQPFKPSINNINSSLSPTFQIWEFPNNGGNSDTFTAEQMILNFKDNFNGNPLAAKTNVVFLSHPHWFDKNEEEKIDTIFRYTDKYLNTNDDGPVIYITLEQAYQAWYTND